MRHSLGLPFSEFLSVLHDNWSSASNKFRPDVHCLHSPFEVNIANTEGLGD
jgi:hypothetical protein